MQETEQAPEREPADIFLWANNADAYKNELDVEIFLFNKNYTPFNNRLYINKNSLKSYLFYHKIYLNSRKIGRASCRERV